ncbi:hypothetical protein BTUL_0001g00840 [Botrytis tulipae]|uniref:Uncharacterized protein n=1 Tax=Botrytis tulipae TaxID=87230 RepID=A0A4Z1F728_9HELO|nr:hypothetical protein BTUL_0001g00840 [Botrytis tulipae]
MDENPKLDTDNLALSRTSSSSFDFTTSPSSISSSPKAFSRLPQPPPFTPPSPLEPLPYSPIHGGGSGSAPPTEIPPRRRSYTKPPNPLTNTPVVNGEIVSGDGWRRHTRVFGGGISKGNGEAIEGPWEPVTIGGFENGRAMTLEEEAENSGEREMKWMKE